MQTGNPKTMWNLPSQTCGHMDTALLHLFIGKTWNTYKLTKIGDRCLKNSNEIHVGNRFYFITKRNINEKECHMELSYLVLDIMLSTRKSLLYTVVKTGFPFLIYFLLVEKKYLVIGLFQCMKTIIFYVYAI